MLARFGLCMLGALLQIPLLASAQDAGVPVAESQGAVVDSAAASTESPTTTATAAESSPTHVDKQALADGNESAA
jgi:formylmethanofuran dehydrogenase subunit B